jgi:hypothetical protein
MPRMMHGPRRESMAGRNFVVFPSAVGKIGRINPKTEIEPRITGIDTDDEELVETISKPV